MNWQFSDNYDVEKAGPDFIMTCPYNDDHKVAIKRFPYHLTKCKKMHPNGPFFQLCPFNAKHCVKEEHYEAHLLECPNSSRLVTQLSSYDTGREPPKPVFNAPKEHKTVEVEYWDDNIVSNENKEEKKEQVCPLEMMAELHQMPATKREKMEAVYKMTHAQCQEAILQLYKRINLDNCIKLADYKSGLNVFCQKMKLPSASVVQTSGEKYYDFGFHYKCRVGNSTFYSKGTFERKKDAEHDACRYALTYFALYHNSK